ncbi:MAG: hypothetical protein A4E42_02080 [Methanoregulaceae archaeon PtaU1.Bin222]|nr:MAG: hypothetical protein A4E42_02080 [Methanoregulaceae archaeon PtaU1.Bin222]
MHPDLPSEELGGKRQFPSFGHPRAAGKGHCGMDTYCDGNGELTSRGKRFPVKGIGVPPFDEPCCHAFPVQDKHAVDGGILDIVEP